MRFEVDKPIFETDISGRIATPPQEPNLPALLSTPQDRAPLPADIVNVYLADLKLEGYSRGAVVVHTRTTPMLRTDPNYWGIIMGHNPAVQKNDRPKFIKIRWINGSNEDCSERDLLIIHRPFWSSEEVLRLRLSKLSPK